MSGLTPREGFDAKAAVATLAKQCPGGAGHRGGPKALCVACLVAAVEGVYQQGFFDAALAAARANPLRSAR